MIEAYLLNRLDNDSHVTAPHHISLFAFADDGLCASRQHGDGPFVRRNRQDDGSDAGRTGLSRSSAGRTGRGHSGVHEYSEPLSVQRVHAELCEHGAMPDVIWLRQPLPRLVGRCDSYRFSGQSWP